MGKCVTGLEPKDCRSDHYLPALSGWMEKAGGRAPCPVCHSGRSVSIQIKNRGVVCNYHCAVKCDAAAADQAVADKVPCHGRRRAPAAAAVDLEQLRALLADRSIPATARLVGGLRVLGDSEADIRQALGLSRATYYRAVSILRQNRRSGTVAEMRPDKPAGSLKNETKPQVRKVRKAA